MPILSSVPVIPSSFSGLRPSSKITLVTPTAPTFSYTPTPTFTTSRKPPCSSVQNYWKVKVSHSHRIARAPIDTEAFSFQYRVDSIVAVSIKMSTDSFLMHQNEQEKFFSYLCISHTIKQHFTIMDTVSHIAHCRIGDFATVRVLSINTNAEVTCDKECASIEKSRDGSLQCGVGWIKKMVNFKATALIIDYEVIMDRDAADNWDIRDYHFPVIDDTGHIHEGRFICEDMVSPNGLSAGILTLFPGTRATYRIYYEPFPNDVKVSSIIVKTGYGDHQARIDLLSIKPMVPDFEEKREEYTIPVQQQDDLRERVESLELEVSNLRTLVMALTEVRTSKDFSKNDSNSPMSDPGIGYHPLGT